MIENKISETIDQAKLDEIIALLKKAEELIPKLISLSVQQRRESFKMGDGSIPFVQKAYEEAKNNANLVPSFVNMNELKKDIDYDAALRQIEMVVTILAERVSDTRMVVGSEALNGALAIYNFVKQAVKQNIPGSKSVQENLKARFMFKKHDDVVSQ